MAANGQGYSGFGGANGSLQMQDTNQSSGNAITSAISSIGKKKASKDGGSGSGSSGGSASSGAAASSGGASASAGA